MGHPRSERDPRARTPGAGLTVPSVPAPPCQELASATDATHLCAGRVGEVCAAATELSQSNVSNHLSCLLDCELVHREQQGRFVYYQLSDGRVGALLGMADELLSDVARGVYECTRIACPPETDQ